MTKTAIALLLILVLSSSQTLSFATTAPSVKANNSVGVPDGDGSYKNFIALFQEFLLWKDPSKNKGLNTLAVVAGESDTVHPDYSKQAVEIRRAEMKALRARLDDMSVLHWTRSQQIDYLAVRSRFDQHAFLLNVSKPWSRDPGFYVDQMLRITFADLPIANSELNGFRSQLRAISNLVEQAMSNLTEVAADYADLAIHNLSNADGVGHGHPYRKVPPAGVIGWYSDLLERAADLQPELQNDISEAKQSVERFGSWLKQNRNKMTASAGVGRDAFNWYLKHVKLMPYTVDEIEVLGLRELNRLWSVYALEQHRNRNLPKIELPTSADDYAERIKSTDEKIRKFLVEENIITIPEYVKTLGTNVPWIVRPDGLNFWENVQFRDPSPDHLHAVIPGHRFDGLVAKHNNHPIRGKITSGARAEGWGVYLEEGMMNAGLIDESPRVRELIYIFGIFRAARVPADVWLQANEMTVNEVVDWWMERTPWLDKNVARVDAEIYLRRPPGYGLGYTVGMLQLQQLLADRKRQLRDKFVLKDFHDRFMAAGRIPISLIRWEMTGLEDEVRNLWPTEPLPSIMAP